MLLSTDMDFLSNFQGRVLFVFKLNYRFTTLDGFVVLFPVRCFVARFRHETRGINLLGRSDRNLLIYLPQITQQSLNYPQSEYLVTTFNEGLVSIIRDCAYQKLVVEFQA